MPALVSTEVIGEMGMIACDPKKVKQVLDL